MAIPDFQSLMRPLVAVLADGQDWPVGSIRDLLADQFALTEADLAERLPSGGTTTFANRVAWALAHIKAAGLIESPRRATYRITDRGRQILTETTGTDRVDLRVLSAFEEYRRFRSQGGDADPSTTSPLAEDLSRDDEPTDKWAEAIDLCRGFFSDRKRFDADERDYKLEVARQVERLLAAVESGGELSSPTREMLANPPNNLLSWRTADEWRKWVDADEEQARGALSAIAGSGTAVDRLGRFLGRLPDDVLATPGARLSVAALLLMGLEPERLPMYRAQPYRVVERVLGWPQPDRGATLAHQYESHRVFTEELLSRLRRAGIDARDVLDAQSLIWMLHWKDEAAAWRGDADADELAQAVRDWQERSGYPTPDDEDAIAKRDRFGELLAPDVIASVSRDQLAEILGEKDYGDLGAGKAPAINFIANSSDEQFEALVRSVGSLLEGEISLGARIDAFLDEPFRGVKEAAATKLLAVRHPNEVLPVYTYRSSGGKGKEGLMQTELLSLEPPAGTTAGAVAADSNELLRVRLEPYLGDDTWGMARFLYDLAESDPTDGGGLEPLDVLAERLYLDRPFLEEAIALLEGKGQLIFYGPPGTGKTYIARELARHLAGQEQERFEVIQFHPSYSYEDFVRGYRPRQDDTRGLVYRLEPGPLLRLAARAEVEPGSRFVLLIDEINRGNLPRILGELLFLLEYRDESVRLMYSDNEDDRFSLPRNLLVIGTMNTADRSIGLIDAALRRRFHFKALFPSQPPIDATLGRWLSDRAPDMAHVAALVDELNRRLRSRFGEHLQVGPSYFMRRGLNEDLLEQIWQVDIMPFLEDQLFGHEDELAEFTLDRIRKPEDISAALELTPGEAISQPSPPADADQPARNSGS